MEPAPEQADWSELLGQIRCECRPLLFRYQKNRILGIYCDLVGPALILKMRFGLLEQSRFLASIQR